MSGRAFQILDSINRVSLTYFMRRTSPRYRIGMIKTLNLKILRIKYTHTPNLGCIPGTGPPIIWYVKTAVPNRTPRIPGQVRKPVGTSSLIIDPFSKVDTHEPVGVRLATDESLFYNYESAV